jgi:peptidyl-prolyl isomerase H (cyclophilin H)
MKKILALILFSLVLYLIYLYWNKYNISEMFFPSFISQPEKKIKKSRSHSEMGRERFVQNNNSNYHQQRRLTQSNQPSYSSRSSHSNQSNHLSQNLNPNCLNGVCRLPTKSINQLTPLKSNNMVTIPESDEIDLNSEDNLLLTETALDLVDEFVQSKNRPHVFMDIKINEEDVGRIVFELFDDVVPYTVDNFIYMCENNYAGSIFHRIIKDFVIQGGDYINGDGTGSNSIYGNRFRDESFDLKHDSKYLLSMANSGPDTNGCQFFITLNKLPNLDNKHVVFGKVADDESKEVVDRLGDVFTNHNDYPIVKCEIADCGRLDTTIITTRSNTEYNSQHN